MVQPNETLLTSGDVAREFGVSTAQVINWDKTGVINAAFRTPGGHRRYRATEVARLRSSFTSKRYRLDVSTEEVILLRNTSKLTWLEIGKRLGMSAEGVRLRYYKALSSAPQPFETTP